jgi:TonB-linked SusC/RagA family outer membrane protein
MLHKCLKALAVVLVVVAAPAAAQDAILRGTVTSDRGDVVQVAAVQIPELNLQALTGANGQYTFVIPAARVRGQSVALRVRSIGFKPGNKVITLNAGEQTIDFTLATDVNMLEAIVVTGVQEATERGKVGFDVRRVDVANLPMAASDPLRTLQGKIGANIVSGSGRPGAQASVLLRGPTMLNAAGRSQDPLYIVDGVIINGNLPEISPNDIESVEVVKGAAAASLYGARAGNGVITITTKTGSRSLEGVKFSARTEAGVSDIERDFGIAHFHGLVTDETGLRFCQAVTGQPACARTFDYLTEQQKLNNDPALFTGDPPGFPVDPGSNASGSASGITGNWLRERFQISSWPGTAYNAVRQTVAPHPYMSNSVDVTGRVGSATRFYASATNLSEQGAIAFLKGFDRNSFRANVDQVIGTQWTIGLTASYSRSSNDGANNDGGNNAFFVLTRQPAMANMLARDTLGRIYIRPNLQGGGGQNSNPLYSFANAVRGDIANRFISGARVQFNPTPWLNFDANIGYDLRRATASQIQDKGYRTTSSTPTTNNGFIFRSTAGDEEVNGSFNARVRRDLTPDLKATLSARYLFEQRDAEQNSGQGRSLSVKGVSTLDNATDSKIVASNFSRIRELSQFVGVNLDFKDRYVVDALVRRDGSSLFGVDNRWATFGRVSLAWRTSQEPWWFLPQVTDLKLRGSYGTAGGSPRFNAQYEAFAITDGGILQLVTLGNRSLKPELHKETEIGADIELFGKYGITATYARANIDRQILQPPLPSSTGYQNQWQNAGALLNITHELSLNIPLLQGRETQWSMNLVYDHNRSWIKRLDVPSYFYGPNQQGAEAMFQARQGELVGTFYGRAFLRGCRDLPAAFRTDCGGTNTSFQVNDEGWLVWVGKNHTPQDGITSNLWETQLPGAQAPWGVALNWGMPIILRGNPVNQADALQVPLGNALPDFRFAITQNFRWRAFSVYALLDAAIGQRVWDEGFHWAHLDFLSADVDQKGKTVENAKPLGYYYRAGNPDNPNGLGGFYDLLGPNNATVEDASYAKLRELSVSYHLGRIGGSGDWDISASGRNLLTITGYRGFDPEVGIAGNNNDQGGQSRALNAVDAFVFPNLRTFTVRLSTSF